MTDNRGLAIRLGRVATGCSQYQLAARVGIHPTLLNQIERGKKVPSADLFQNIIREFKRVPPDSSLVASVLREVEKLARTT